MLAGEVVVALAATAPIVAGVAWVVGWLIAEKRRERRQLRAAMHVARQARVTRHLGGPVAPLVGEDRQIIHPIRPTVS